MTDRQHMLRALEYEQEIENLNNLLILKDLQLQARARENLKLLKTVDKSKRHLTYLV